MVGRSCRKGGVYISILFFQMEGVLVSQPVGIDAGVVRVFKNVRRTMLTEAGGTMMGKLRVD